MAKHVDIQMYTVTDKRAKGGKRKLYRVLVNEQRKRVCVVGGVVTDTVSIMGMKIKATDKTDFSNPDIELDTQAYQSDIDGEYFLHLRKALAEWHNQGKPDTYHYCW